MAQIPPGGINQPLAPNGPANLGQQNVNNGKFVVKAPKLKEKKRSLSEIATEFKRSQETEKYVKQLGDDLHSDIEELRKLMKEITMILQKMQGILTELNLTGPAPAFETFAKAHEKIENDHAATEEDYEKAITAANDVLTELRKIKKPSKDVRGKIANYENQKARLEKAIVAFKNRDVKVGAKGITQPQLMTRIGNASATLTTQMVQSTQVTAARNAFVALCTAAQPDIRAISTQFAKITAMKKTLVDMQEEATSILQATNAAKANQVVLDPQIAVNAQKLIDACTSRIEELGSCIVAGEVLTGIHAVRQEANKHIADLYASQAKRAALKKEIQKHSMEIKSEYRRSEDNLRDALKALAKDSDWVQHLQKVQDSWNTLAGPLPKMNFKSLEKLKGIHNSGAEWWGQWQRLQNKLDPLDGTAGIDVTDVKALRKIITLGSPVVDAAADHFEELEDFEKELGGWAIAEERKSWEDREIAMGATYNDVVRAAKSIEAVAALPKEAVDAIVWDSILQQQHWSDNPAAIAWTHQWKQAMRVTLGI